MQAETRIVTAATDAAEIDRWIAESFVGVDVDDLRVNNADSLGSDDVPHLSLTEETHGENYRRAYGEWGCVREVLWADHDGDPLGHVLTDHGLMSAGSYAVEFARRNGRVKLSLRQPCWRKACPTT